MDARFDTADAAPTRPSRRSLRWLFCARAGFLVLILASFIQHSCVASYLVSGNSMLPNYVDGDRVVVARLPSFLTNPQRGDTVIARVNGEILIKRVMGLPGETLEIEHGLLQQPQGFVADPVPPLFRRMGEMQPVTLGDDEYFLMGDHRRVSIDSREFGPVHRDDILGQVILRVQAER